MKMTNRVPGLFIYHLILFITVVNNAFGSNDCSGGVCKIPQAPQSRSSNQDSLRDVPTLSLEEFLNVSHQHHQQQKQQATENKTTGMGSWLTRLLPAWFRGGARAAGNRTPDSPLGSRIETDALGEVVVDGSKYWGAQTQRSLENFDIGGPRERMPYQVIRGLAIVKKCMAIYNLKMGNLHADKADAIMMAAEEIMSGKLQSHFPLVVFQTRSGCHSNMNVNEVISNRANEILGHPLGKKLPVHPNDDVNMGQSWNDVFPAAIHIAAVLELHGSLLPGLTELFEQLQAKEEEFNGIIKVGRTHLQDDALITLGQEFSGYAHQVRKAIQRVEAALPALYELALGGTAVGTDFNTVEGFDTEIAKMIAAETGFPFVVAANKFEALATHNALVEASAMMGVVAGSLMEIANDLHFLGLDPNCGQGKIILPGNEPGSSFKPDKVNPSQCEALAMACAQVMGNHVATNIGGVHGHFELNAFKPVMILNLLSSARLVGDSCRSFAQHCVSSIQVNKECTSELLHKPQTEAAALNSKLEDATIMEAAQKTAMESQRELQNQQRKLKIGLVGFGNFGQFLAKTFVQYADVYAINRSDRTAVAKKMGVKFYPAFDMVKFLKNDLDVIIMCTSVISFEKMLGTLPKDQIRDTLMVDVLSVKMHPKEVMLSSLPPTTDILCTHPMFGPESGKHSWQGLPFVFDKVRVSNQDRTNRFLELWEVERCKMVEMSCELHDEYAANSQFITHLMGRILGQQGLSRTPIDTKGFENVLNLVDTTCSDSFDLFYSLYKYNSNSEETLRKLRESFALVERQIAAKEAYLAAREIAMNERQDLLIECRSLIKEVLTSTALKASDEDGIMQAISDITMKIADPQQAPLS